MKRLSILVVAIMTFMAAMAVPAQKGVTIAAIQPDGTTLNIKLCGDEYFNYRTTVDGYAVIENADGFYEYAQMVNSRCITTGVRAHNVGSRSAEELALLEKTGKCEMSDFQIDMVRKARAMASGDVQKAKREAQAPRGLVIMVNFADVAFQREKAEFDSMLNQRNYTDAGATGSVIDYFEAASNGQYSPHFDLFGPYTLDRNMEYYGTNTTTTDGSRGSDVHAAQMVVDAVNKLASDPNANVDFTNYDADNDGIIDVVYVFYAGYAESEGASSKTIWPHRSKIHDDLVSGQTVFDGKRLVDYACSSELAGTYGTRITGIGTFCHEFSHVLGLADLYVTDYSSNHKTPSAWDLMDQGSYNNSKKTPPTWSAFERFYVGWLTPEVLNSAEYYTLEDLQCSNKAYMITSSGKFSGTVKYPSPTTYYLLENRQKVGWDAALPGHGMLVTKIAWNLNTWSNNTPNNNPNACVVSLYTPEGATDRSSSSDVWPGATGTTEFAPISIYPVSQITEISDPQNACGEGAYVVRFAFMGGEPEPYKVEFNTRNMGSCATKFEIETAPRAGVTLPDVTPDAGYTFHGWCTEGKALDVDAGRAGETFNPKNNTILYAVYTNADGDTIEGFNVNCMLETFNRFTCDPGTDVVADLDEYTDNGGWSGYKVECANGAAKVGSESRSGNLVSPKVQIKNSATIEFTVRAETEGVVNVEVNGKAATRQSFTIGTTDTLLVAEFEGIPDQPKFKFTSEVKIMYVNDIEICGEAYEEPIVNPGVETGVNANIKLVRISATEAMLTGMNEGDKVECFDAAGRALFTFKANATEQTFARPQGFYIIRVSNPSTTTVVKGL